MDIEKLNYAQLQHDIQIAYTDNNQQGKPCLLFIHGLANYLSVWHWNILELQNHYRCIAIDLPGNGHSSRTNCNYGIPFFAEIVVEFIAKLDLKNVILVGHSMGGQIALFTALHHADKIDKLILFAPAGFEYFSAHEAMLLKSAMTFGNFMVLDEMQITQSIQQAFHQQSTIANKIIEDLHVIIQKNNRTQYRKMLDQCIHSMLEMQVFSALNKIQHDTLVFFGENDQLIPNQFLHATTPKAIGEKAVKLMPNARLITYPATGHFAQIERAKEVNLAMQKFIQHR